MAVAFVRKADSMPELKDGFGQKEMLAGTYEGGVRAYRCVLKADALSVRKCSGIHCRFFA